MEQQSFFSDQNTRRTFKHPPVPADRRWLLDEDMELTVWFDDRLAPTGFQIVYDRKHDARLFSWSRSFGFTHCRVETGPAPEALGTPLECARLRHDFFTRSRIVDGKIGLFVDQRIREYGREKGRLPGDPLPEIEGNYPA